MYIVLVHYKEWKSACHPMLDDDLIRKTEIVEVENLSEINKMFSRIEKIDILMSKIEEQNLNKPQNPQLNMGAVRSSRLILDLSDEGKYFVKLENGSIVFKPDNFGEAGKFECLYWIYVNGDCYYR